MTSFFHNDRYVGQLLIRDGVITQDELFLGLDQQKKDRDFLCSTLVRMGFATEQKIYSILSLQIGIPYIDLSEIRIDPHVLTLVPGRFALACKFIPLKVQDREFSIAMSDPLNTDAIDEIKSYLGAEKVRVFLSGEQGIREAIRVYYGL